VTAIPILHVSEASAKNGVPLHAALRLTARGPAMLAAATLAAAIAAIAGFPAYVIPLLGGRI
jgi:hypothetical protein